MKAVTINVQISKCPKQYESIRLGGEWTLEDGETEQDAMKRALETLEEFYKEYTQPKPKSGKQVLTFDKDAKTIESICKRMTDGVALEKVLEYYEPDEQAMAVLKAAAVLG